MAYLNSEITNARLVWLEIADRVKVIALILLGMIVASYLASALGYAPADMQFRG